jgi:hypothetical protein
VLNTCSASLNSNCGYNHVNRSMHFSRDKLCLFVSLLPKLKCITYAASSSVSKLRVIHLANSLICSIPLNMDSCYFGTEKEHFFSNY